ATIQNSKVTNRSNRIRGKTRESDVQPPRDSLITVEVGKRAGDRSMFSNIAPSQRVPHLRRLYRLLTAASTALRLDQRRGPVPLRKNRRRQLAQSLVVDLMAEPRAQGRRTIRSGHQRSDHCDPNGAGSGGDDSGCLPPPRDQRRDVL